MKKIYIILIWIIMVSIVTGQNYFSGRNHECATLQNAMNILEMREKGVSMQILQPDTIRDFRAQSPGGHFILHWDESGIHAVPVSDLSGNGIPDYVDSAMVYLETAWGTYINQMNYSAPLNDNGEWIDSYKVYFTDMPYYGLTTGSGIDIENVPGENWSSFLELENDYAESYFYSKNLDGLRVTCVHEFHHAIQFGYNIRFQDFFFYEMTSTWFEDYFFDPVNDYLQYLPSFYDDIGSKSFDSFQGLYPYGNSIYLHMINSQYGPDLVKHVWDEIRSQNAMPALIDVLKSEQFNDEWIKSLAQYAKWLWFTGNRATDRMYFKDAPLFPMVLPQKQDFFLFSDSMSASLFLNAYSWRYIQVDDVQNKALSVKIDTEPGDKYGVFVINENEVSDFVRPENQTISNPAISDSIIVVLINADQQDALDFKLELNLLENFVAINTFDGLAQEGRNLIKWNSGYEILNKYWLICRRDEFGNNLNLSQIAGQEYSYKEKKYVFNDYDIHPGQVYTYFLKNIFSNGDSTIIDSVTIVSKIPDKTLMLQNYPNPFNDRTIITISTPGNSNVDLHIYNTAGQVVRTLLNNVSFNQDNYQLTWDGTNNLNRKVSSGIYFAVLNTGRSVQVDKLVLIR